LIVLCILFGTIILQTVYLALLNKRNIKRRRAAGKTGAHIDYSLESSTHWAKLRQRQMEAMVAEGHQEVYNAQAFMDL
jgi:hypothetical protein